MFEIIEYRSLELIDIDVMRPADIHFGELLIAYGLDKKEDLETTAIRLFQIAGLETPEGVDLDQPKFSTERGFYLFEICQIISGTPRNLQTTLAWLLRQYLPTDPALWQRLRDFRDAYRQTLKGCTSDLGKAYRLWVNFCCAIMAKMSVDEAAAQFDLERFESAALVELSQRYGQPLAPGLKEPKRWGTPVPMPESEAYIEHFGLKVEDWDALREKRREELRQEHELLFLLQNGFVIEPNG